MVLDDIDHRILAELAIDGRISWRKLGERVGLGPTAAADRARRLENSGVVVRYTTVVDPASVGIGLRAIVDLRIAPSVHPDDFERHLARHAEVASAFHVTGPFDYQLLLACPDVAALDTVLRGWKRDGWVTESNTRILMTEIDLAGLRATP